MMSLGTVYYALSDYARAVSTFLECLSCCSKDIVDDTGKPKSHKYPTLRFNLGIAYIDNRNPIEGLKHLDTSLQLLHALYGSKPNERTFRALNHKGIGLTHLERYEEAYEVFLKAFQTAKVLHPIRPTLDMATIMGNIGSCLSFMGPANREEERKYLEAAIAAFQELIQNQPHIGYANTLMNLGSFYASSDKVKALKLLEEALNMNSLLFHGRSNLGSAQTYCNLARLHLVPQTRSNCIKALEYIKLAKKMYAQLYPIHPQLALLFYMHGELSLFLEDEANSIINLTSALEQYELLHRQSPCSADLVKVHMALARVYKRSDFQKSLEHFFEAQNVK